MMTYGDGVADIDLKSLMKFHKANGKIATVTAVSMSSRFGGMEIDSKKQVTSFREKGKDENKWINAGFFVLDKDVFKYLEKDMTNMMWEDEPLEKLTLNGELVAYQHTGFWKCMDALRDKIELETMWNNGNAKWKIWR